MHLLTLTRTCPGCQQATGQRHGLGCRLLYRLLTDPARPPAGLLVHHTDTRLADCGCPHALIAAPGRPGDHRPGCLRAQWVTPVHPPADTSGHWTIAYSIPGTAHPTGFCTVPGYTDWRTAARALDALARDGVRPVGVFAALSTTAAAAAVTPRATA